MAETLLSPVVLQGVPQLLELASTALVTGNNNPAIVQNLQKHSARDPHTAAGAGFVGWPTECPALGPAGAQGSGWAPHTVVGCFGGHTAGASTAKTQQ